MTNTFMIVYSMLVGDKVSGVSMNETITAGSKEEAVNQFWKNTDKNKHRINCVWQLCEEFPVEVKQEVITLMSRYGQPRFAIPDGNDHWVVTGNARFTRGGCAKDGTLEYFDPEGGPLFMLGDDILNIGKPIKKISIEDSKQEGLFQVRLEVQS